MTDTACTQCGVAYDMGRSYRVELGCGVPTDKDRLQTIPAKIYKRPKPADPIYSRFASIRHRASKKEIPFDLTQELIKHILNQPCCYCGETEGIQLDRKVGELGYTAANVVPACKRCNTVKSMYLTHAEMMVVAETLGWNHGS
jgi:5-methylcytosine-specific restriction endonuclease McrA